MTLCEPRPVSNADDLVVLSSDLSGRNRDDVVEVLDAAKRMRSFVDAVEVRAHRRMRELSESGSAERSEVAIADAADGDGRHGRQVARRDELCLEAPELEDALTHGAVSGAHLDVIASASKNLPVDVRAEFLTHTDDLVARSRRVGIDAFRREVRNLAKDLLSQSFTGADADELNAQRAASEVKRWTDKISGMHHTMLVLDPVRDAEVAAAAAREVSRLRQVDGNRELTWKQLETAAWIICVIGRTTRSTGSLGVDSRTPAGATSGSDPGRRSNAAVDRAPQVIAISHVAHLRAQAVRAGLCETSGGVDLPIGTLRRLCCDAEIIPAVMDGTSRVLDLGRSKRTASAEQRHALRAIHATCVFPGCHASFDSCRIHHVDWWTRDVGPTNLDNLVPVCEHDHHRLHEGGWTLSLDPDRVATWVRPDGTVHHVGPTTDRAP